MQLGVADHIWTIGKLVDAALDGVGSRAEWPALWPVHGN
jgi:hypothetical protein